MKTTFTDCRKPATDSEIAEVEARTGLHFPAALRRVFQEFNDGQPSPSWYPDPAAGVEVHQCLAISDGGLLAEPIYERLVRQLRLLPAGFFPFAIDPGGDYLFVDCGEASAPVFLWMHESAGEIHPLGVGLEEFWLKLVDHE